MSEVEVLERQDIIDISHVMLSQHLYYAQGKRIPEIANMLALPKDTVARYLSTELPKEERILQVIDFVSRNCFSILQPVTQMLDRLSNDIKTMSIRDGDGKINKDAVYARNNTVNAYSSLVKTYTAILEVLRRANDTTDDKAPMKFELNIIQNNKLSH